LLTVFDPMLFALALLVMLKGFHRRRAWAEWARKGSSRADWRALAGYLLNHRAILRKKDRGLSHLALFWGIVFMVVVVIAAQFKPTLPRGLSLVLSLLSDVLGVAMLAGLAFFLLRRHSEDPQKGPKRALFPLWVLLVVVLTGFLAEGTRMSIVSQDSVWASPAGLIFSLGLPESPFFMQLMLRIHFFGVLLLIALLPYTAFRHIAAAATNVAYASSRRKGAVRALPLQEGDMGAGTVTDLTWGQCLDAEACVSCGRCEEQCPAFISGKSLSPRRVMQGISALLEAAGHNRGAVQTSPELTEAVPDRDIWACTGCLACAVHCPVLVDPTNMIIDMRRYRTLKLGNLPGETHPLVRDLRLYGDVNGRGAAHRMDWAFGQDVPVLSEGNKDRDILLWVGCSGAFHPQYMETARSLVRILTQAGASFGVLGKKELCCGDPVRRLGEESLFLELAEKNIKVLKERRIKTVVPLCPHCYHTLLHDYKEMGAEINVVHAVDLVLDLIDQKAIALKYPVEKRVALHDPCYLGRANGLYEPIRRLARAIPGVELKELPRNREKAFCCGGGNGGMWLHEDTGERLNRMRAKEASDAGVDLVGTACPYCLTMLQDGMGALDVEAPPDVADIIQLAARSMSRD